MHRSELGDGRGWKMSLKLCFLFVPLLPLNLHAASEAHPTLAITPLIPVNSMPCRQQFSRLASDLVISPMQS